MFTGFVRFDNGLIMCNCTPHSIKFEDNGLVREIASSGFVLKANPIEEVISGEGELPILVRTVFEPSDEGTAEIESLESRGILPIGSIISAQAWPGRVYGLVPVAGYERKPPAERQYRADKFNVF